MKNPLPVDPAMDGEDLAWSESLKFVTAASTIWATSARYAERGTRTPTVTVLVNLKRHIKLGRSPLILPERRDVRAT
ncbi:hypothetical protein GCM10009838_59430 [Catenulispora subtropica]|uniref:Uncharacterized protein n=1 Tax=Catenulispora subtropica TaxID=450798 RepID=A0ABP5E225_9ACTN